MRIFAYCTQPAAAMVEKAVGVRPLVSPPLRAAMLDPVQLEGYDFLYFRLHGDPRIPDEWLGESHTRELVPAIWRNQIMTADLSGAVVLLANCYGASSPMAQEMYRSGAAVVIGGYGPNYAAGKSLRGADLLAKWLLAGLRNDFPPRAALILAKGKLAMTAHRRSTRDTLKFKIINRSNSNEQ